MGSDDDGISDASPRGVAAIPPFYRPPGKIHNGVKAKPIRKNEFDSDQSWDGVYSGSTGKDAASLDTSQSSKDIDSSGAGPVQPQLTKSIKEQVADIFKESGKETSNGSTFLTMDNFVKITKEICSFPTFFNGPLYKRILYLWNTHTIKSHSQRVIIWTEFIREDLRVGVDPDEEQEGEKNDLLEHLDTVITKEIFKWYWVEEMEDFDASERFFRLLKKPFENYIGKNDFLPYMKELLRDHPVSEPKTIGFSQISEFDLAFICSCFTYAYSFYIVQKMRRALNSYPITQNFRISTQLPSSLVYSTRLTDVTPVESPRGKYVVPTFSQHSIKSTRRKISIKSRDISVMNIFMSSIVAFGSWIMTVIIRLREMT